MPRVTKRDFHFSEHKSARDRVKPWKMKNVQYRQRRGKAVINATRLIFA